MNLPLHASVTPHHASMAPRRFVTAAGLFDGHDAAINIIRRVLQAHGVEVVHLGHNRSVAEIAAAALQEDVHAIAVSSYQGGHVEYLQYLLERLRQQGGEEIRVFAGGGGVIIPQEIALLEAAGITRVYSPQDGQQLGLDGMIEDMLMRCQFEPSAHAPDSLQPLQQGDRRALSHLLSALENARGDAGLPAQLRRAAEQVDAVPVLGITGTGGAGKSSLTDELIRRFRIGQADALKLAVIAVDPSRRKTGGALLGDRIRMNAIDHDNIFMRSVATRRANTELPACIAPMIDACKLSGFDLVIVETPGIGQGGAGIAELADVSLYVMTPEFGAPSQLEKIDMLDFADFVAINKFDRSGAQDAYRDVCKQVQRNRQAFDQPPEQMPVFGSIAAQFNDPGVTALYHALLAFLQQKGLPARPDALPPTGIRCTADAHRLIPGERIRYLAEIAQTVRAYRTHTAEQAEQARQKQQLSAARAMLLDEAPGADASQCADLDRLIAQRDAQLDHESKALLQTWPQLQADYGAAQHTTVIRGREVVTELSVTTLSGSRIPKVAVPQFTDHGEILRWRKQENLPGHFPYTAGCFPFKREHEDPTRMFAGEGDAFKTNRRFKHLCEHTEAKRLSTAFDSVTLYGCDPQQRPDIYGKVGNSGVSIATLDDMQALYDGFDLSDPLTSVSMTINGPAPIILAMFFNTAIEQKLAAFERSEGRPPTAEQAADLRAQTLRSVRGTIQADILKEDQGQNTCIFSTEFALKLMGDMQACFIQQNIRNFYSVSISGYHIAEAGANPISQLAFTLSNAFTYVESYRARGMDIDDFAPNLSFFFSNGMDPEYTVIGRVARRIWAVAMRDRYGANARSQQLKYHIQTSGRSLHAEEIDFNDIRTTLQSLIAIYDNCNSLHTNAFDEAVTTPTAESVRRALAIQLIINHEWGPAITQNSHQGSFIVEQLTDLVEQAVLAEFERLSARGGVIGAMETGYQRGRIQDESMHYERKKHDGSLRIIGVNTFLNPDGRAAPAVQPVRSSEQEKQSQIRRLHDFQQRHRAQADASLARLQQTALAGENVFAELLDTVRHCSLGQIVDALYRVGGQYRRHT